MCTRQVAFVQTPQRFRKDLPDDPLGNHAASQVRNPIWHQPLVAEACVLLCSSNRSFSLSDLTLCVCENACVRADWWVGGPLVDLLPILTLSSAYRRKRKKKKQQQQHQTSILIPFPSPCPFFGVAFVVAYSTT